MTTPDLNALADRATWRGRNAPLIAWMHERRSNRLPWQWWAGSYGDVEYEGAFALGPFDTRDQAIAAARARYRTRATLPAYIIEAKSIRTAWLTMKPPSRAASMGRGDRGIRHRARLTHSRTGKSTTANGHFAHHHGRDSGSFASPISTSAACRANIAATNLSSSGRFGSRFGR